ncbi:MAG TPA: heavy metal translocating P-type ATPase [Bryobacteraceae bacterium]|nr:heavy metal translocating P-type ATPase [Bryobacteraceae bacterium]
MNAAPPERVDLPVSGMTCAACARTIERTLAHTSGVSRAQVNLATATATVEYDPSQVQVRDFVGAIEELGYGVPATAPRPDAEEPSYRRRLWVAILFSAPVLVLGMAHGLVAPHLAAWIELALTIPVVFYSGAPFYSGAWSALRHHSANMNTLIALGTGAAFLYSLYETVAGSHRVYYEAAAVIIALILLGRTLEARARGRAADALRRLIDLQPRTAHVMRGAVEVELSVADVRAGDILVVRPGERIPVDGEITEGESAIDEAILTGESLPAEKGPGAKVFAGTFNQSGAFRFEALQVGRGTVLEQMIELVKQAQGSRAPVARLADVVSGYFTLGVLIAAALTFAAWLFLSTVSAALVNAVAVLIIACPCALGLATPVAIMVGTGRGAERGILIKSGEALEAASRIDTVILDKTGTLTLGKPQVREILPEAGYTAEELLRLAASAERYSEHPLGKALVEEAAAREIALEPTTEFSAVPGYGVRARLAGRQILVGNNRLTGRNGSTPYLTVTVDGATAGSIAVADVLKPEAAEAVRRLRELHFDVWMLTGDHRETAEVIARQAGIDHVLAEVLPQEKAEQIKKLQASGKRVAMVGDGVNDAPALALADLGIAMGSGTDVAMQAGGVTLLRGNLLGVPESLHLARRTMRIIRQNLFWAFAYNTIGIPVAALGLLSPIVASAAMALSSVTVVTNSLRLK